jgi:hypothetical protein
VGLHVVFKGAVFAMEGAFGGVFIAQGEIMALAFTGIKDVGRDSADDIEEIVVSVLSADAVPFGLRDFEDEIGFERALGGLIGIAPAGEKEEPIFLKFAGEDESFGAAAMFDGILRGNGFAFRRGGPLRPELRFSGDVSVSENM